MNAPFENARLLADARQHAAQTRTEFEPYDGANAVTRYDGRGRLIFANAGARRIMTPERIAELEKNVREDAEI